MQLRLIRNATLRMRYGGVEFLIDPMLGVRHSMRPLAGVPERNPTVDLPCSIDEVIDGVEAIVVSHLHPDHWDEAAIGVLPRHLPVYCQTGDVETFVGLGFASVTPLAGPVMFGGARLTPTAGSHGRDSVAEKMGDVIGLVFRADNEPIVYWAGDTVICEQVRDVIARVQPDVIVIHSGGAVVAGQTIIMDVADTIEIARLAPDATVVAVHLEAMAHCPVTRADVRAAADLANLGPRVVIPDNGDVMEF